jgi:ergothioneine biosynthesis protein EgtB
VAGTRRRSEVRARFRRIRSASVSMCRPLNAEEYRLQPMEDVSPPWWNLGHTSWFFVRNVLTPFNGQRTPEDDDYDYLLNSYYASLGERLPRGRRGAIGRPTTGEILDYRSSVDRRVEELIETFPDDHLDEVLGVLEVGLQHEQQHQELFYTEIKCIRHQNVASLRQPYVEGEQPQIAIAPQPLAFVPLAGGLHEFGHRGNAWCWDNELPVHRYFLEPYALAQRLVTCREYQEFIDDGGYRNPLLWLDNGWQQVQAAGWQAPLYWERRDGEWWIWTLSGMRPLEAEEPVSHVSFYEADAFARWTSATAAEAGGVRLPSEREWEHAALSCGEPPDNGPYLDAGWLHPRAATAEAHPHSPLQLRQMHGCLWQWTSSYYEPYPGYRPFRGVLAEYNGKFMDNQRVLRGGSCVTPRDHYRPTYRNFWPAATRFQFTGIRLARTIGE